MLLCDKDVKMCNMMIHLISGTIIHPLLRSPRIEKHPVISTRITIIKTNGRKHGKQKHDVNAKYP